MISLHIKILDDLSQKYSHLIEQVNIFTENKINLEDIMNKQHSNAIDWNIPQDRIKQIEKYSSNITYERFLHNLSKKLQKLVFVNLLFVRYLK